MDSFCNDLYPNKSQRQWGVSHNVHWVALVVESGLDRMLQMVRGDPHHHYLYGLCEIDVMMSYCKTWHDALQLMHDRVSTKPGMAFRTCTY